MLWPSLKRLFRMENSSQMNEVDLKEKVVELLLKEGYSKTK